VNEKNRTHLLGSCAVAALLNELGLESRRAGTLPQTKRVRAISVVPQGAPRAGVRDKWDKRATQASATPLMAANVAPIPFSAASLRMAISFAASSPNISSKKAEPSGGSSQVSMTSVPPSTATNE
jgi:hypothetical protein